MAMVNRCRRGPDGKTADELRKGRKFARALPHFAEKLLFVVPGVTKGVARAEPRWEARTVRRREATERVDLTFLNSVSAKPWDGPKKVRDVRIVLLDVSSPAAMAEAEASGKGGRLYMSKADIMKHGLTEGCLRCRCLAEGQRAQGHSGGCRTRLEAEIAKSEDGRARFTTAYLRSLPGDEGENPMQVRRHQQQFQSHREKMESRTSRWMPEKRRENAVHKMLVLKQMTQIVEVHSPIQDRRLTTACTSSGGRPRRSEPMLRHWWRRIRRRACSAGVSNGLAFGMGSGAASRPDQS